MTTQTFGIESITDQELHTASGGIVFLPFLVAGGMAAAKGAGAAAGATAGYYAVEAIAEAVRGE